MKKIALQNMAIWYVWSLYKRAKQSRQCQPHTRFCYCFRQVPCIYFSIAISFILSYWIDWYKMFCMGDELYRLIRIKLMDIFSISLNLEYPRNFFKESLWITPPPPPPPPPHPTPHPTPTPPPHPPPHPHPPTPPTLFLCLWIWRMPTDEWQYAETWILWYSQKQ